MFWNVLQNIFIVFCITMFVVHVSSKFYNNSKNIPKKSNKPKLKPRPKPKHEPSCHIVYPSFHDKYKSEELDYIHVTNM